jgi:hypothetical protein
MSQICHTYKRKNSTSAERTRIYCHHIESHYEVATSGTIDDRKKRSNRNNKRNRINKMHCVGRYITNENDKEVQHNSKIIMKPTFYYNFYEQNDSVIDNNLSELKPLFQTDNNVMVRIKEAGFEIVDSYIGSIMTHDYYPVFLLIPRIEAIKVNNKSRADHDCLLWLLNKHSNLNIRGKQRSGHSTQYVTAGAHSSNFRKGIHIKKLCSEGKRFYEPYLQKWLCKAKSFATQYLPCGLLSGLKEAKFLVDDDVCYEKSNHKKDVNEPNNSLYASMATSYNYIAPAHVDKDSFLSCMFVTLNMEQYDVDSKSPQYKEKMDICVYFSFPDYKKTVALRPGDVFFFNPLKRHCVSQRCVEYIDHKIFCTTFYINTKTISGNDATKSINFKHVGKEIYS